MCFQKSLLAKIRVIYNRYLTSKNLSTALCCMTIGRYLSLFEEEDVEDDESWDEEGDDCSSSNP